MDPKDLTPWRRVRIMVTGRVDQHEAIVTDRRDQHGWAILRVTAPETSSLAGAELKHEDYVPVEYADAFLLDLTRQPGRALGLRVRTADKIEQRDYSGPRAARPNVTGVVESYDTGHGICFLVKYDGQDGYGTTAYYDPDELTVIS